MNQYDFHSPKASQITDAVMDMIITDLLPFDFVDGAGFQKLVQKLDSRYKIPSKTYFAQTLLPQKFQEKKAEVEEILQETDTVSATADCWTSISKEPYIAISGHFITSSWDLREVNTGTYYFVQSHTAQNIKDRIQESMGSLNVLAMISDSAANMVAGLRTWNRLSCFAHDLQLCISHSLDDDCDAILAKCRRIVTHFNHSNKAAHELTSLIRKRDPQQKKKKLLQEVATRWNSSHFMVERLLMFALLV